MIDIDRARRNELILEAESHLRAGRPAEAFEILSGIDCENEPYARRLLIQATEQSERWEDLAVVLSDPQSGEELIQLVEALSRLGRIDDAMAHLREPDRPPLAEHIRRELQDRLDRLAAIRGRRG